MLQSIDCVLPDEILALIIHGNEHTAQCCHKFYRIVIHHLKILKWIRQLLSITFEDIALLSFEQIYHYVYTQCITKKRNIVDMSLNIGLREFVAHHVIGQQNTDAKVRLKMVTDILMYWNNTRPYGAACVHRIVEKRTGIHVKCVGCRDCE